MLTFKSTPDEAVAGGQEFGPRKAFVPPRVPHRSTRRKYRLTISIGGCGSSGRPLGRSHPQCSVDRDNLHLVPRSVIRAAAKVLLTRKVGAVQAP